MRFLLLTVWLSVLGGCASSHAILANSEGQELVCQVESFGILFPHVAAKDKFDKCVKDAQLKGYKIKSQD